MLRIGFSCRLPRHISRLLPVTVAASLLLCTYPVALAQQLPYMNAGPTSVFAQIDFARMISDGQAWDETQRNLQTALLDSGVVSALDLQAPDKAVKEFKQGTSELKAQDSKSAIRAFQRAVKIYPDFVSAHNALGLAYLDQQDPRAREEFELAAKLDDRFPGPFLNLGLLAITGNDFSTAEANLLKAANLTPEDPRTLTALAFAENGNHQYAKSMQTANRVHALEHHGFANVHYIGAAAAMSLRDFNASRSQLQTFLAEDPGNPLSPVARQQLDAFAAGRGTTEEAGGASSIEQLPATAQVRRITFPNSEYLQAQLNTVVNNPDSDDCDKCSPIPDAATSPATPTELDSAFRVPAVTSWQKLFTIHQVVDETALFFSVTSHGHMVGDLSLADIHVRDDNKPPDRVLQFIPQSRLPLRLGLLIDTSESVQERVTFEKRAAEKFIDRVLNKDSDLAFVEGFRDEATVTQDFTRDPVKLAQGIQKLSTGGNGTAIFDAVFLACWKLAAYPDQGRTARVLVVVTDGEDNSSHRSLKQAIEEAEAAGVTVYTVSTAERTADDTDANRILKLLAERTGGESLFPGNLRSLDASLNELPTVIRSRYLIAYKAADFKPDGKFRPIHVTAERAGRRLHVQVRKGYYARAILASN
jgi:Ca-activated chloride channel homolog